MLKPTISYGDIERIARDGSPLLLQAVGRVFGLGPQERAALGRNGVGGLPTWTWVVVALAAGVVVGVRVDRHWPGKVPEWIGGQGS